MVVSPLDKRIIKLVVDSLLRIGIRIYFTELRPRTLLAVEVRVPQDQLFVLDRIA